MLHPIKFFCCLAASWSYIAAMDYSCNSIGDKRHQAVNTSEIVRVNVGGVMHTTTRATLINYPDSMLGAMFGGSMDTTQDEAGCYFIDRDGTTFCHILNFLRCGRLVLPSDFCQLELLTAEADFYQIEQLTTAILQWKQLNSRIDSSLEVFKHQLAFRCHFLGNRVSVFLLMTKIHQLILSLSLSVGHYFMPDAILLSSMDL